MSVCDEEPCKSKREEYEHEVRAGNGLGAIVRLNCVLKNEIEKTFQRTFQIWLALFAQAVACTALGLFPHVVCQLLWVLSLIAFAALLLWQARLTWIKARLRGKIRDCDNQNFKIARVHSEMTMACPEECHLPLVTLECNCP